MALKKLESAKFLRQFTGSDRKLLALSIAKEGDVREIAGAICKNDLDSYGFESKCFDKYKKDEHAYLDFLECPQVEEGMFQCSKCKSKKIFTMSKQTRSGDEAITVFARCSECKNGWVI